VKEALMDTQGDLARDGREKDVDIEMSCPRTRERWEAGTSVA
jgi:hypothetical protein